MCVRHLRCRSCLRSVAMHGVSVVLAETTVPCFAIATHAVPVSEPDFDTRCVSRNGELIRLRPEVDDGTRARRLPYLLEHTTDRPLLTRMKHHIHVDVPYLRFAPS